MSAPVETERKFIIKIPDSHLLDKCECIDITQIYLASEPGVTRRVRRLIRKDGVKYVETKKKRISVLSCIEDEREISKTLFDELSLKIRAGSRPINKKRYKYPYLGHILEIDVYPEWQSLAIMEIELSLESEKYSIPEEISVVREVTGEVGFSNSALSENFPDERDYL